MAKIPEKPSDTLVADMLTDHLEIVASSGGAKYFEFFRVTGIFFKILLLKADLHRVSRGLPPVKIFFSKCFRNFYFFPEISLKTRRNDFRVKIRSPSDFLKLKSKWPVFTPQGAVCEVNDYNLPSIIESSDRLKTPISTAFGPIK